MNLPHPEEQSVLGQTSANTNASAVAEKWMADWGVPESDRDWWRQNVHIVVYDSFPPEVLARYTVFPGAIAETDPSGHRVIQILASWLNPGVLAHEQAHTSYWILLTDAQKQAWAGLYSAYCQVPGPIKDLFAQKPYGLTNADEGHSDIYRYLGLQMPEELLQYYPKLWEPGMVIPPPPALPPVFVPEPVPAAPKPTTQPPANGRAGCFPGSQLVQLILNARVHRRLA